MTTAEIRAKLHALLDEAIKEADGQFGRLTMDADRLRAATGAIRDLTEAICLWDGRVAVVAKEQPYHE